MGGPTRGCNGLVRLAAGLVAAGALASDGTAGQVTALDGPPHALPAVRQALSVLPRRPHRVRIVDEAQVGLESRARFRRAEAFVSRGEPVVYLTSHSPILRAAAQGSSAHVYALAAVIWHEMAHIDGADEAEAQRREQILWTRFLRDDRVSTVAGLRYLKALNDRRVPALTAPPSP
jgi:hypothetical protein